MTRKLSVPMLIQSFTFHAPTPGPALLVFGAIHGNEICGPQAITKVMSQLADGELTLNTGSVIFVPVANPLAYAHHVRYVKENLNRIFKRSMKSTSEEGEFANILCALVDRCDVLLDLHSTTASSKPFIYIDFPTTRNRQWAATLGADHAIVGWPALYKNMGRSQQAFDTASYAGPQGKDCLTVECGQHNAPAAPQFAYKVILRTLRHYGMIKGTSSKKALTAITMQDGFFRQHKNDRLAKDWKHLARIRKGDPLIIKTDGSILKAPYDAFIIMPKASAPVGDDWLYLGKAAKT